MLLQRSAQDRCQHGSGLQFGSDHAPLVWCRYDVEQFQKIEALIGQQMERFEHEEEAALLLCERVTEAQKLATMQVWSFSACVTAC